MLDKTWGKAFAKRKVKVWCTKCTKKIIYGTESTKRQPLGGRGAGLSCSLGGKGGERVRGGVGWGGGRGHMFVRLYIFSGKLIDKQ